MEMHHAHHPSHAPAHGDEAPSEPAARHGMAVIGVDTVYFSHLPMFMSPHDWQFIAHGEFADADPATAYRQDRQANEARRLYTFNPKRFVLPDLLTGPNGERARSSSFVGTLFRNHFEQPEAHPEEAVPIAEDIVVNVVGVVHAHKLDPEAAAPEKLEYVLFGKGEERFVAHLIARPPDFDQLMSVAIEGRDFSDEELRHGVPVTVPDRANRHEKRLKDGEQGVAAIARVNGSGEEIQLQAVSELYLESNDLKAAM
jgi:hypothetical protein